MGAGVSEPTIDVVVVDYEETRKVTIAPEPDWDLWHRQHPAACAHIPSISGYCPSCGSCIDHPIADVLRDLSARRDHPEHYPPLGLLKTFREKINPFATWLLQMSGYLP